MSRGVMSTAASVLAVLGVASCTRAPSVVSAPIDVSIGSVKEAPQLMGAGKGSGELCTVWLTAEPIVKSAAGCYMDQHVSDETGVLTYPCSGDGPADARFGEHRYEGKVEGGNVNLELDTELDWEDNCRWGTHHVIHGALPKGGAPAKGTLSWRYVDRVLSGTDCSGVCMAKTEFAVTEPAGSAPPRARLRQIDDDEQDETY